MAQLLECSAPEIRGELRLDGVEGRVDVVCGVEVSRLRKVLDRCRVPVRREGERREGAEGGDCDRKRDERLLPFMTSPVRDGAVDGPRRCPDLSEHGSEDRLLRTLGGLPFLILVLGVRERDVALLGGGLGDRRHHQLAALGVKLVLARDGRRVDGHDPGLVVRREVSHRVGEGLHLDLHLGGCGAGLVVHGYVADLVLEAVEVPLREILRIEVEDLEGPARAVGTPVDELLIIGRDVVERPGHLRSAVLGRARNGRPAFRYGAYLMAPRASGPMPNGRGGERRR